jgi:glucose/arabinose dehydrogenase
MEQTRAFFLAAAALFTLASCAENAHLAPSAGYGPSPTLPPPEKSLFFTYNVPSTKPWPEGVTPTPAQGLKVEAFAKGLTHPRWIAVLPNGDVLVAESDHAAQAGDWKGYGGLVETAFRKLQGLTVKSPDRIILLRDSKGGGHADIQSIFLSGLNAPFGMALVGETLYVADTDALMAFPYRSGETHISDPGRKVVDLPAGDIDHHWTKNVIASPDGTKLYVTVGSNSNAGENGLAAEEGRAAIWEVDPKTGGHRIFASGLRNPNGMGWSPQGALWAAVNERDEIGGDVPPDYMTSVKDGGFYGWPFSYYGQHVDDRLSPQNPEAVAKAIPPDYALGAHTASLGLAFARGNSLGPTYASGVFIGQHGSWNRKPFSGYRVIFVPFSGETPSGPPVTVLDGFLQPDGTAYGRPVGVALDKSGALLVADDVGNTIWRVTKR